MRRKRVHEKRLVADPKFNSEIVSKFINMVMEKGKKSIAEKMVYGAFEVLKKQTNEPDILKVFNKALKLCFDSICTSSMR